METTRLSSKGQVVLPKSIRMAHQWKSGAEFIVEDTADGVLLRPVGHLPKTRLEDVIGCTGYQGPARSVEEMDASIAAGATSRQDQSTC